MKKILFFGFVLMLNVVMLAQQPSPNDPIGRNLFPPELVMSHQVEIGLTENQATAIRNEVVKAQPKFIELQWQMQRETEKLAGMLQQAPIDESKTLSVAETLMTLEINIKKTHLSLLIRIKNALTDEQRMKLTEIQKRSVR